MMLYVWFVIAGAFAGVCAGLFGVGGGMIIVPALVWIFTAYHFPPEVVTLSYAEETVEINLVN